jgi:hypothetical protein
MTSARTSPSTPSTSASTQPVPEEPDLAELATLVVRLAHDTLVSHRSAAQLWGLWIPPFTGIEVTRAAVSRGSRYTTGVQRRPVTSHRRRIERGDTTTLYGLPITTIARTWLDLAVSCADLYDMVAVGDSALRRGATADELCAVARRHPGVRGRRRALSSLPLLDVRSRSRPESRIRAGLVMAGLPAPEVNQPVHDENGGWLAEPDLCYREARLALEYNGADHATVQQMRKDAVRLLDLQRAGWAVRTYTSRHAFGSLDEVVSDVRRLLSRRAPHLLVGPHMRHRVTDPHRERRQNRRHSA